MGDDGRYRAETGCAALAGLRGDSPVATAPPASRWLLIESHRPWPRNALTSLDAGAATRARTASPRPASAGPGNAAAGNAGTDSAGAESPSAASASAASAGVGIAGAGVGGVVGDGLGMDKTLVSTRRTQLQVLTAVRFRDFRVVLGCRAR